MQALRRLPALRSCSLQQHSGAAIAATLTRTSRASRACLLPTRAGKTAEVYAAELAAAEASGEWLRAFEIVAEVGVLELSLESSATESAIRSLARGGQWQKSAKMLNELMSRHSPSGDTLLAVLKALAQHKEVEQAQALLQALEQLPPSDALAPARNFVCRALASSGGAAAAVEMLDGLLMRQGEQPTLITYDTYSHVVKECMKEGLIEEAEEVLEWRDYLQE